MSGPDFIEELRRFRDSESRSEFSHIDDYFKDLNK